ncbi:TniB family NTP-binding protein [Qingshengfaniella alkalisoli]|uniref:AAA family ATPase n=1 Tax=Qingshengfaniella alkalisoli TaxID=2599296 RepID=A0A5B8J3S7_9RHOB|nr:TniB family NTP-binding protein [Qingshengfaniella alkalisoli]QDY71358.1 AAA family ATPase [Qingshengfaniella alkalisoli]
MSQHAQTARILEHLRSLHIGSDMDAQITDQLARLLKRDEAGELCAEPIRFTRTNETRGIMVVGGAGSGKSHLVHRALMKFPVLAEGELGRRRFLECSVPSPATLKSMVLEMLEKSGYPEVSSNRQVWSLVQMLRARMSTTGTVVLWIDEAHDLFCADRKLILRALKALMQGDDSVIVILSGTEELAQVIRTDPQVQRRFSTVAFPALVPELQGDLFRQIIDDYCRRANLGAPIEADLVGRVFHGARYRFGRAIELIVRGIEVALYAEASELTIDHFARAWAMHEGCSPDQNVFYAEQYQLLRLDQDLEDAQPVRKRRRG